MPKPKQQQQQPQQQQRKRRRQRKAKPVPKNVNGTISSTPRTNSSVIHTLAKPAMGQPSTLNPYVICRTNPFIAKGGGGIPDGGNTSFITTDLFAVNTIACSQAHSSFMMQLTGWLPAPIMLAPYPSTALTLDSVTLTAPASVQPDGTVSANSWFPMGVAPNMLAIDGGVVPGSDVIDPFYSTDARLVSWGVRIIYTGPVNTCAGSISITSNSCSLTRVGTSTDSFSTTGSTHAQKVGFLTVENDQTTVFNTVSGSPILDCDILIDPTIMTRDTVTLRPEQGALIIPRHKTRDFKLQPTMGTGQGVTVAYQGGNATNGSLYRNIMASVNDAYSGGIFWFDNDWEGVLVVFNGINSDATFRVETVMCMEFNPSSSSGFFPLTKKESMMNENAIKQAETITKARPVATPLTGRP
jgi:hypothetical protein